METTLTLTEKIKDAIHSASSIQEAIKIADSFKFTKDAILTKPVKPFISKGASSAQAREYANDLENYENALLKYKAEQKSIVSFNNALYNEVEAFVKEHTGFNRLVPNQYKAKVWSIAYDQGHSSGLSEIANYLIELIDIFDVKVEDVLGSQLLAVEFGYKQCEKGHNIQRALSEFKKLYD